MTLPTPNLDDRRFQDIVDDAKRLIPALCPQWTNHNLSDPGVTLIELFAWMTDLTLYRINQVPERLFVKFLELMGIERYSPGAARAEVTFWLTSTEADAVTVPAETEVAAAHQEGDEQLVFLTEEPLEIVQPHMTMCVTATAAGAYSDHSADLLYGRAEIVCFPSTPPAPGDAIYFGFDAALSGNVVRLDLGIQDIHGRGVNPSSPPMRWEAWTGDEWVPLARQADDTGGLNRAGQVVLVIPRRHAPLALGDATSGRHSAWWLRAMMREAAAGQPNYVTSPRIETVRAASLGGVVDAQHARRFGAEHLGMSDGTPGQCFALTHSPVLPRQAAETIRVGDDGDDVAWSEVEDFSASGPADRHYVCDWASGVIRFGPLIRYPDGPRQRGAIPPAGADIVMSGYRSGGGERGNVAAGALSLLRTTIPYIARVSNSRPATGGRDAETMENLKQRGPLVLRAGQRAVTAGDYAQLATEASPVVARARCLPPLHRGEPVRLLIVPWVRKDSADIQIDDLGVTDVLSDELHAHLDERCVLGTTFKVTTPYYQGVSITALVRGRPGHQPRVIEDRILEGLYRYVCPLRGGPDGQGWPFDTDLNTAALAQLIGGIDGVDTVREVVVFEADVRNRRRVGRGLDVISLEPESLFLSFRHQVAVQ